MITRETRFQAISRSGQEVGKLHALIPRSFLRGSNCAALTEGDLKNVNFAFTWDRITIGYACQSKTTTPPSSNRSMGRY